MKAQSTKSNPVVSTVILALGLLSMPALASTNVQCQSVLTGSLKVFVNLSNPSQGQGTATIGIDSNVDAQIVNGSYGVTYGKANTRLAGLNVVKLTAEGLLDGKKELAAEFISYAQASAHEPVGEISSGRIKLGYKSNTGEFVVLEEAHMNCISLN